MILTRFLYTKDRTIGRLTHEGFSAWTLECPWLANKPNESCIPEGEYLLVYDWSPKFDRDMWRVDSVPRRSGIRVHAATKPRHLKGCIAPGFTLTAGAAGLERSDEALAEFHRITEGTDQFLIRIERGEVWK